MADNGYRKFGTFEGVFTPTVLTILGVILYARLGWVVGNAGFLGAVLIILISNVITFTTSLSASTMSTNIKVEAGGAYSIISKSLGLEAGGAIGISLYFAQTLSVSLYIFGFAEAVKFAFPQVQFKSVLLFTWLFLWIISSVSTKLAFKIQFLILTIIALSLISFFIGAFGTSSPEIVTIGQFQDANFGQVYAIFFPAVTGILAGIGMSGDLKDPAKNIPRGSLIAILLCLFIYLGVAFMLDYAVDAETLRGNFTIMLSIGKWRWLVIAGMMGATLSSGLGSIVSSPRLLQAMAVHRSVP
ncbi:MAG: amino acid permease [Acidobacteria bacterium]|nr:amino acid permease [Acidobacteriota bacterium]